MQPGTTKPRFDGSFTYHGTFVGQHADGTIS
jgi:hypothetical protein